MRKINLNSPFQGKGDHNKKKYKENIDVYPCYHEAGGYKLTVPFVALTI